MDSDINVSEILKALHENTSHEDYGSTLATLANVDIEFDMLPSDQFDVNHNESGIRPHLHSEMRPHPNSDYDLVVLDKLQRCESLQLPVDPVCWSSSHVASWVQNMLFLSAPKQECDIIINRVLQTGVTGRLLSIAAYQYYRDIFGCQGDYVKRCFDTWLQDLSLTWKCTGNVDMINQFQTPNTPMTSECDPFITGFSGLWTPSHSPTDVTLTSDLPLCSSVNHYVETQPYYMNTTYTRMASVDNIKQEMTSVFPPAASNQVIYQTTYFPPSPDSTTGGIDGSQRFASESASDVTDSDSEASVTDTTPIMPTKPARKGPGRPPKPKYNIVPKRRQPILYKFILECLRDPNLQCYVEWVNKSEGVFKFNSKRKDQFAELWSVTKGRKKQPMTYQNMARALRNYTRANQGIMQRVPKKLHYKFTQKVFIDDN